MKIKPDADSECALNAEDISDSDIYESMKEMSGYIDITLEDFRQIYLHAYRHAHKKVSDTIARDKTFSGGDIPGAGGVPKISENEADTGVRAFLNNYINKMRGSEHSPPRVGLKEIMWSWIGAFSGIALVAYCNMKIIASTDMLLLIASFGASAVLIYGAVKSPLAQPRNLLGGHVLSAVIGVACFKFFYFNPWFASALAVSSAIAVMHITKTLHPPGGATALIAVIGSDQIHSLGFLYAVVPVGAGALLMLGVALAVNNIPRSRRYPEFWL